MKVKVQVVTTTDDGQESIRELACIERDDLTAESLGLSVAESKALLQSLQEVVVEWQMKTYLDGQSHCPDCGQLRHSKGSHHTAFRTVFGTISVESPRFEHCSCQSHDTQSFSPLAVLLPEHTTPELLYLETKWASLASYGMTVKMLEDVLPLGEALQAITIRNHVLKIAERLEDELGDEQVFFIEGCPMTWAELPIPDGPLTIGIDGGYVKAQGMEQGWFEVIAGKSILSFRRDDEQPKSSSQCFAFVQTYDEKPKRRLFDLLQSQGMQANQQIEFLSDGGDTVRDLQLYLSPEAEHLLDWFHVTMRVTTLTQTAKGLPEQAGEYLNGLELLASLRLCSNVPGQWAVQTALGGHQSILELTQPGGRLYESRQAIIDGVSRSRYLKLKVPMGAMYAFVEVDTNVLPNFDDSVFAMDLLEQKHILVAPGTSFNVPYSNHFRITNLPETGILADVFDRIEALLVLYATAERRGAAG